MRTMMLVVAAASFLLFAGSMLWRRHRYQELAELHAGLEGQYQDDKWERFDLANQGRVERLVGPNDKALAAYHARLKDQYRKAADRPWRIVEPDPPIPLP